MIRDGISEMDILAARKAAMELAAQWHDEQAEYYVGLRQDHDCTNEHEREAWKLCREREKIHRLSAQSIRSIL